jgi:hypothetical protein
MNERIRQLAEQAKASVPAGLLVNEWIERYNEIFAELIVRECAQVCNDMNTEYEGEDILATWCANAFKLHFGVTDEE